MPSKPLLTQLEALQKATLNTDGARQGSFSELFHMFLDIAEEPELLEASRPAKDKLIKGAIETCARTALRDSKLSIQQLRMMRIDSASLLHGSFFAGASVGSFFYFEKGKQGLVAIDAGGGHMLFSRMSMIELPEGAAPMPGPPPGSQRS